MAFALSVGERLAIQWVLISNSGYDLDGARHQSRVMRRLELAKAGNKSLLDMEEGEAAKTVYELENADLVWLRDQIKKRFETKDFNPLTAGYGAQVLDQLDEILKGAEPKSA